MKNYPYFESNQLNLNSHCKHMSLLQGRTHAFVSLQDSGGLLLDEMNFQVVDMSVMQAGLEVVENHMILVCCCNRCMLLYVSWLFWEWEWKLVLPVRPEDSDVGWLAFRCCSRLMRRIE